MTELRLMIAEHRAAELLAALQAAVNGEAHWRPRASQLLLDIYNGVMPPEPTQATEALREVDARKRAAEILGNICDD